MLCQPHHFGMERPLSALPKYLHLASNLKRLLLQMTCSLRWLETLAFSSKLKDSALHSYSVRFRLLVVSPFLELRVFQSERHISAYSREYPSTIVGNRKLIGRKARFPPFFQNTVCPNLVFFSELERRIPSTQLSSKSRIASANSMSRVNMLTKKRTLSAEYLR